MFKDSILTFLISAIALSFVSLSYGQGFSMVSFDPLPMDLSATTHSRVDLNGRKCGLVKVQCVLPNMTFVGNVIGDVKYDNGEYWVYVIDKTKQLSVRHSRLLPLDVDFSTMNKNGIESGITYRLKLSIPEALYNSLLFNSDNSNDNSSTTNLNKMNSPETDIPDNSIMTGVVTDESDGEPLIGCAIYYGVGGEATNIDGVYSFKNLKPGATLSFKYVGYKTREITFTGKIPPTFDVSLKPGKGTIKEDFFYDPNDTSEYFDLKGNKLSQRPTKKGTYIRVLNGKPERFTVN